MLSHLDRLEAESIEIFREVVAETDRPVLLYSIGKDSSVLLHLALKAFHPAPPPFPFLHIASGWDFRAMLEHRDRTASRHGFELLVHTNEEAARAGVNPFETPIPEYTRRMLTESLKAALDQHRFDAAFGGARRDEERSRAKERFLSFRDARHRWDPRSQRPELWNLYNARKREDETLRVFPLSNWTEIDIWEYIERERIELVPLYFAARRPVVRRGESWIMVDDERLPLGRGEEPELREVRFRTLGCYPLSGAIDSRARSVRDILDEVRASARSERQGRVIDRDARATMEHKKLEGYF